MSQPASVFVVPAQGASVRDPRTGELLPAEGLYVPAHDPHWMALLRFGDVIAQPGSDTPDAPARPARVRPAAGEQ